MADEAEAMDVEVQEEDSDKKKVIFSCTLLIYANAAASNSADTHFHDM